MIFNATPMLIDIIQCYSYTMFNQMNFPALIITYHFANLDCIPIVIPSVNSSFLSTKITWNIWKMIWYVYIDIVELIWWIYYINQIYIYIRSTVYVRETFKLIIYIYIVQGKTFFYFFIFFSKSSSSFIFYFFF